MAYNPHLKFTVAFSSEAVIDTREAYAGALIDLNADLGGTLDGNRFFDEPGQPIRPMLADQLGAKDAESAMRRFRRHLVQGHLGALRPVAGAGTVMDNIAREGGRSWLVSELPRNTARVALDIPDLRLNLMVPNGFVASGSIYRRDAVRAGRAMAFVSPYSGDMQTAAETGVAGIGLSRSPEHAQVLLDAGAIAVCASMEEVSRQIHELRHSPQA